jgi:hypothetical protein
MADLATNVGCQSTADRPPGADAPEEPAENVGCAVFLCFEIVVDSRVNESRSTVAVVGAVRALGVARSWLVLPLSCGNKSTDDPV